MTLPQPHQQFLDQALTILKQDGRLLGVAAGGSYINAALDEFSDLDLVIVSHNDSQAAIMAERHGLAESLGDLLQAFSGEHVGEPRLLICMYGEQPLHVDLKFVALDDFRNQRVEDPVVLWQRQGQLSQAINEVPARYPQLNAQWIEDRFWKWVHYGAAKLGRGELFEVIDFLAFLRTTVLGPMAKTLAGSQPRGLRLLEQECPDLLPAFTATLPLAHERKQVARAFQAAIDLYLDLRKRLSDPKLRCNQRAQQITCRYLARVLADSNPADRGFELWRMDDNGNEFLMETFANRELAEKQRHLFEARGHKQIYWTKPKRVQN